MNIRTDSPRASKTSKSSLDNSRFSPYQKSHSRLKGEKFIYPRETSTGGPETEMYMPFARVALSKNPRKFTRVPYRDQKHCGTRSVNSFSSRLATSGSEIWLTSHLLASNLEASAL